MEKAAESGWKKFTKVLGGYGLNVMGEPIQEGLQQGISIANRERALSGEAPSIFGLAEDTLHTTANALTSKTPENAANRQEILDAAKEGAKIAAMVGGGGIGRREDSRFAGAQNDSTKAGSGTEAADYEGIYQQAKIVQQEMDSTLNEIASQLGISMNPGVSKSVASMRDKTAKKSTAGQVYSVLDMKDHARNKLELNSFDQIPQVLELLAQKNIPCETEAIGPTEWGYRGFHVTWRTKGGLGCELQLTRPDVWQVKLESDVIYDKWRNVTDAINLSDAEYTAMMSDMQRSNEMWNQLDLPDFKILESSVSDNLRALNISSADTGRDGTIQFPETNSLTRMAGSGEISSTRPDSVMQAMEVPPFNPSSAFTILQGTAEINNSISPEQQNNASVLPNETISIRHQLKDNIVKAGYSEEAGERALDGGGIGRREDSNAGAQTHTPEQQQVMNEYESSVDSNLADFVKVVVNSSYSTAIDNQSYFLSPVSQQQSSDIKNRTGVDLEGFKRKITAKAIRHIDKRHGENGSADKTMANAEDLARIQYVLDNYDDISVLEQRSSKYRDSQNNPAPMIRYGKQIDGHYYVVEAIPNTKAKTVAIVTAYMSDGSQDTNKMNQTDALKMYNPLDDVQNAHTVSDSFSAS
ncbi:MAG: hypothetical protein RR051_04210, partial [Clostridiales bacterium]